MSSIIDSKIIDPVFAIVIALYILYGAWELLSKAFNNLMDHEFQNKEKKKLQEIIMSHKKVKGFHDLKTRYAGRKPFVQFHLELDGKMTLMESHDIAEYLEQKIMEAFEGAEVIVHQDPEGVDEKRQFSD